MQRAQNTFGTLSGPAAGARPPAVWMLLVALLFQVTAGAFLTPDTTRLGAFNLAASEICAFGGAGVGQNRDDSGTALPQPGGDGAIHCVFCLPLHAASLAVPQALLLADLTVRPDEPAISGKASQPRPARVWGAASPQAPPLS